MGTRLADNDFEGPIVEILVRLSVSNSLVREIEQTLIGDAYAMGVAAKVVDPLAH